MRSREPSSAELRRKGARSRGQARSRKVADRSVGGDKPPPWFFRWPGLILSVLVAAAYVRIFSAGFVVFDDDFHVYANPFLNPPTLSSVAQFWEHSYKELYVPLAYTIFAFIARFAQVPAHLDTSIGQSISLDPTWFHVASVALHLANVWLCFRLVRRLTGRERIAWICSLVFALHPLQLESVGWVSELRGLTSGTFVLLALNAFVLARQVGNRALAFKLIAASALSVLFAMLCKPSAAALPLIALAIDRITFETPWRKALAVASVWTAVVVPFVLITRTSQHIPAAGHSQLWQRPFIAGDALAFYLFKILLPIKLCVDYGRTPASVMSHAWGYVAWVLPAALLAVGYRNRRRRPIMWLGALLFSMFLLPTSGLVPFAYQAFSTVADRYAYLPLIGVGLIVADAVERAGTRTIVTRGAAAVIIGLAVLTVGQSGHWLTSADFLLHTIDVNPSAGFAYNNLGDIELANGDLSAAQAHLEEGVRRDPTHVKTYINLAEVYVALNKPAEAERAIDQAMKAPDRTSDDLSNLGIALMKMNQPARALQALASAVAIEPSSPTYVFNQANALSAVGHFEQAEAAFRRCIALAPTLAGAHTGLGIVLAETGRLPDAIAEFRAALRFQPNDPAALDDLRKAEELMQRQGH
jgi:tetratricopeptide (TPR) repeat protein